MAAGNTVFSTNLQTLRKQRGVTQEQLANYLGVSPQAVSKWENGSYPEGDLLPKISEYFGVSISYLYGQEKETVSIEQTILDVFYEIMSKVPENFQDNQSQDSQVEDNRYQIYFDKMLDIAWAFQTGAWKNNKNYFKRTIPDKNHRTASVLTTDAGVGYFNLNVEKQFFTLVREPEDGFVKNLPITDDLRALFQLLGKKGALEIVYYLLTLYWGEFVTASTIAKNIGMSLEETEALLEEAGRLQAHSNSAFFCINVLNTEGNEKAYGINQGSACLYLALFLTADSILKPPFGYQMQICSRTKSWVNRQDVEEMLRGERENGKNV